MPTEEVAIDGSNFEQYFFDVKKHRPKKGQVMASYSAMADFVDGDLKRDVIEMLIESESGALSASQLMQKLAGAVEKDSYRVCREIAEDLLGGMSRDEVANKPYRFRLEYFYYTERQHIPKKDPHWRVIPLLNWRITDDGGVDFDTVLPDCALPA